MRPEQTGLVARLGCAVICLAVISRQIMFFSILSISVIASSLFLGLKYFIVMREILPESSICLVILFTTVISTVIWCHRIWYKLIQQYWHTKISLENLDKTTERDYDCGKLIFLSVPVLLWVFCFVVFSDMNFTYLICCHVVGYLIFLVENRFQYFST